MVPSAQRPHTGLSAASGDSDTKAATEGGGRQLGPARWAPQPAARGQVPKMPKPGIYIYMCYIR